MKRVLSKLQMSQIRGGERWACLAVRNVIQTECHVILEGDSEVVEAVTAVDAADYMHKKYGANQVNCTRAN